MRPSIPVIIGHTVTQASLLKKADDLSVELLREGRDFDMDLSGKWQCAQRTYFVPSHDLPQTSVSLALATYTILERQLDCLPPLENPVMALNALQMMGRFTQLSVNHKTIILDVAHNAEGAQWLAARLREKGFPKVSAIWASLQDKALSQIATMMKSCVSHWMIGGFSKSVLRAASVDVLDSALREAGIADIEHYVNIQDAFNAALEREDETIVVFGSFYTVAEVLTTLGLDKKPMPYHGIMQSTVTKEGCRDHG